MLACNPLLLPTERCLFQLEKELRVGQLYKWQKLNTGKVEFLPRDCVEPLIKIENSGKRKNTKLVLLSDMCSGSAGA